MYLPDPVPGVAQWLVLVGPFCQISDSAGAVALPISRQELLLVLSRLESLLAQAYSAALRCHSIEKNCNRLMLEWEAAKSPHLFPFMRAELSIYPLTATETQLDFSGYYNPPFGPLGNVINTLVGHRIAEVSVHRFVTDVAGYLRTTLAETQAG